MAKSDLDFYGLNTHRWIGIVLPYNSQQNQINGDAGFGWRYRVAIMGYHPKDSSIRDEEIVFALVALGVSDGTGAGNRQRTPRISQGDVVIGIFLDGDNRQNPVITGVLGRTEGVKYGKGRFDPKPGFVGTTQPGELFDRQESSEAHGICSPKAISSTKSQNKPNIGGLLKSGLPDIPTLGAIPKPPGNISSLVSSQLGGALDNVGDLTADLDDAMGATQEQLDQALDMF